MDLTQAEKDLAIDDIHKHVVHTPYQEYPRHLHKAGGKHLEVKNDEEKAKAMKDGWKVKPVVEPDAAAAADKSDAKA